MPTDRGRSPPSPACACGCGAAGWSGSRWAARRRRRGSAPRSCCCWPGPTGARSATRDLRGGAAMRVAVDGAQDVRWDPVEGGPPAAAVEADAVVNAAGSKNDLLPWTAARKREHYESRVGTTRLLAGALDAARGPRVLVNASGADYYGPRE